MADVLSALGDALAGRYTIERELGRGGMATVWLAQDLRHDRPVAIKVLRPELSAMLGAERFLREIQLTAKLQHPHILPLLDSGEAQGVLYYVMPFVEGESLRQRLQREWQLSVEETLRITRGVAGALAYAHEQGVIHRDIKPENILLYQGEPMVADFGIALAAAAAGGERLTETGLSLGTPAYMSPEQASAPNTLDGRSDQYSLACVVYEMLAGEPPYSGPTAQAIIAKRFSEPVPHLSTLRAVPSGVDAAVTRALAKAPADRFSNMAEFVVALDRAPPRRLVTRRMAALLGGAAAVAAMALAAFLLRPVSRSQPMVSRQLTFSGKATQPAISPDGHSVVYVSGTHTLAVQPVTGGETNAPASPSRWVYAPRWSADGRSIITNGMADSTQLGGTYATSLTGAAAQRVLDDQVLFDTGADSTVVVRMLRERPAIQIIDWRAPSRARTISLPDSLAPTGLETVAWSPARNLLAFEGRGSIWTIPLAGGTPSHLAHGRAPRWAAGSNAVYFLDGAPGGEALFRIRVDRGSGARRGEALRLASLSGAADLDVRGGLLAYTLASTSAHARALELGSQATSDRLLTSGTARVTGVSLTSDGQRVAFSQVRGQDADIFEIPFAGGSARAIVSTAALETAPAWSPDGTQLAYVREDSDGRNVVVLDLASGVSRRLGAIANVTSAAYAESRALWSADGSQLSFLGPDRHHVTVVDVHSQTRQLLFLPDSVGAGYGEIVPSPDGRAVAASTLRRWTDWGEIWTTQRDSADWRRVPGPFGESYPIAWNTAGWLYLQNHRAASTDYGPERWELWRMRGARGSPLLVAHVPEGCEQLSVSADGRRAVCVSRRVESDVYLATGFDPELR